MIVDKIDMLVTKLLKPFDYMYNKIGPFWFMVVLVLTLTAVVSTCTPASGYLDGYEDEAQDKILDVGDVIVTHCDTIIYDDDDVPVYIIIKWDH
jgi:hypothetical protein